MSPNDGGAAFPVPAINWIDEYGCQCTAVGSDGMTLRDWFAGQAISNVVNDWSLSDPDIVRRVATNAYRLADEMLKAREGAQ